LWFRSDKKARTHLDKERLNNKFSIKFDSQKDEVIV
jgi:hypothetical protein